MSVTTTAHLNFAGDARAALEFYQSVFGGDLAMFTYGDAHNPAGAAPDQLMWGGVTADNGFAIMAYDVQRDVAYDKGERAFFVSLRGETQDEIAGFWAGLVDGATIITDLGPAPWSPLYGMLTDKFGVTWVIDVRVDHAG